MRFVELFETRCPVIGMLHLPALPGTPANVLPVREIVAHCLRETALYLEAGVDGLLIENMHDLPYLNRKVGPEITAAMTAVAGAVKSLSDIPCGVQVLAGANKEALAIAHATDLDFVRAEGFVFAHVADEGSMESDAGELLRYRRYIGAEHILLLTDIKKKHSAHALTADVDLVQTAKAASFFKSDGLIITGQSTGEAVSIEDLERVKKAVELPIIVGSGASETGLDKFFKLADALIVGSSFKEEGYWANQLDYDRLASFMRRVWSLREE